MDVCFSELILFRNSIYFLEIIEIEGYSEYEKLNICKSYLIKKELEENALTFDDVTFTDKAYEKIIKNYTKESGIRSLERMIDKILRKIVTELAINNKNKKVRSPSRDRTFL